MYGLQMNKEPVYTSMGNKLLHHGVVTEKFKRTGIATPISLQIAPTSRCNLKCTFCSNVNREKHEDLNHYLITNLLRVFRKRVKTVEWTGGGDPTMYTHINEVIEFAKRMGLKQGFITNGVLLEDKLSRVSLDSLHWLRISMNCLDYVPSIEIPKFDGTLGFSYVWNEKTTDNVIARLDLHIKKYNPNYVRVVPNCQTSTAEQEANNRVLGARIKTMGNPYFYQAKIFSKPKRCWWAYFKPFILHDGWVYPCSSVVLNLDAEKQFHEKYRWVHIEDLPRLYDGKALPLHTGNCSHCVFRAQNDMVDDLAHPNGMEDFI